MSSVEKELSQSLTATAWKRIGIHHHHGINIPLGSIHTKDSAGIGEFFDLLPLIDWCHQLHLDVIQLLPLNESGENEPSPYNALSSCALHPIYLSLHELPYCEETPHLKTILSQLRKLKTTKRIAYSEVLRLKRSFLSSYLATVGHKLAKKERYFNFVKRQNWLLEYALFKVLKDKNCGKNWKHWPANEQNLTHQKRKKWLKDYQREVEFYCLVQYLCFEQLTKVKDYATKKKVFLKGDIPILVNPDSADMWAHKNFFHLDWVVGRPSSSLEPEGQYWGFPLYHWKAMEENHHEWWKKRLQTAAQLYHLYRIDHIIGFFCLWIIPEGQKPKTGHYSPKQQDLMHAQGRSLLKTLISFTDMLPIGEDLGSSYPFIKTTLSAYGIPGTKIFRWERAWEKDGFFIPYDHYSPISMSSVSTHDIDTTQLWWQKFPKEASQYAHQKKWTYFEKLTAHQQREILWDNHHSGSLFHINLLQEYLALTPELTWDDPEDERINYPGTIQPRNWTYRYKQPIETLSTNQALNDAFHTILSP